MPRRVLTSLVTPAVLGLLLSGCTGGAAEDERPGTGDGARTPAPATSTAPPESAQQRLDRLGAAATVARADVCDQVPTAEVRTALGIAEDGPAPVLERTAPGDPVEVRVDGRDRVVPVQEHGCSWSLRSGPLADLTPGERSAVFRVFGPPVDAARAQQLVDAARGTPGCTDLADVARLGEPGVALGCGPGELRLEGLVADGWVVCGLTRRDLADDGGATTLAERTTTWCATALEQLTDDR